MLFYFQGKISTKDLEEESNHITTWTITAAKLGEINETDIDRWLYEAVTLLEINVYYDVEDQKLQKIAENIRELVHNNNNGNIDISIVLKMLKELSEGLEAYHTHKSYRLSRTILDVLSKN